MADTLYVIQVNPDTGNAKVTRKPNTQNFVVGKDRISFESNEPKTTIVYRDSSPVAEIAAGKPFQIGNGKGPFLCVKAGKHHFDCGRMLGNTFSKWGDTEGDGTPVDQDPGS
jgi:hypothetical protein